ncbi:MAG TPA: Ig domain-containing protein [Candidatus Acidoferrales bacterium]|nr:Ig domain-containing protein [Candidatus Acidoferrales bacterium]
MTTLAITTTSPLPAATAGTAYSQQFAATGGTPPYQWSTATGSTLPAGLTLSSTGLLSGTPSASGTFSVTVTDSESPAAAVTESFTLPVIGSGNASLLSGNYAFEVSGFNASGAVVLGGSFHADGAGNLSSGVEDVTNSAGNTNQTFTGSYIIGADNRGTLVFSSLSGSPTYAFAIDATGAHGRLIEFDATGVRGSGRVEKQSVSVCTFNTISGEYAVGITGTATGLGGFTAGPVALAGRFTASPPGSAAGTGSIGNGEMDANAPGFTSYAQETVSGTYQTTSQTARCTATIFPASLPSMKFSAYPVSASEYFLVETDGAGTPFLTVGTLRQQIGYPFSSPAGEFTGASVAGLTGQFFSGSTYVPDQAIASLTVTGVSAFTFAGVENRAGTASTFSGTANFVNADTFGRVQTDIVNPVAPVFYMINQNEAFAVGTINDNPFFGVFEPQTGGPFTALALKSTFAVGSSSPAVNSAQDVSGVLTLDGIQTISGAEDQSTTSANNASLTLAGTYIINSTTGLGLLSFTSPPGISGAFYAATPSQFVLITTTAGDTNPVLVFGGNWQ